MRSTKQMFLGLLALAILAVVGIGLSAPERLPPGLRLALENATGITQHKPGEKSGGPRNDGAADNQQSSSKRDARADARSARPVAVEVRSARQSKTSTDIRAIGSLQSDESVEVASEIAGRVAEISFTEGGAVAANDVLVRLDEALVAAEVADAKARLTLAKQNDERTRPLAKTGVVTGRSRDEAIAGVQTATAAYELARTRLAKHTLRAPFSGIAGVRNVSVGAYVAVGAPLVRLEKINVLKVDFAVPEIYLSDVSVGQTVDVSVDAFPEQVFKGEIYAIDPQVDINGRALKVRAKLSNSDKRLRPGLFARITIHGLAERDVTVVPESAVVPRGGDSYIFQVSNGQAVSSRVKLGARRNAEVEVLEGLEPNATIVTAGQQKLRDGMAVDIVSVDAPDAAVSPAGTPTSQRGPGGSG